MGDLELREALGLMKVSHEMKVKGGPELSELEKVTG